MYYYIVDANKLTPREFEKVQATLYSSIAEYHISGEVVRVTGIRTIKQLVETAFFHQAKTIVAVGTDATLEEIIGVAGERPITIGYIPLKPTPMSAVLGIPDIPQACKFLAVRRIETIDLGIINTNQQEVKNFFLTKLELGFNLRSVSGFNFFGLKTASTLSKVKSFEIQFKVDQLYTASAEIIMALIINTRGVSSNKEIGNPVDGQLDLLLLPPLNRNQLMLNYKNILEGKFEKIPNSSVIHFQELEILSPNDMPLEVDGLTVAQTPCKLSIKSQAMHLIVGKERKF